MALQIAPLIALERRPPVPDGVLFAAGRTPQLVLAGNNGMAQSYALLSNFLASMAQLWMGKGIEPAEQVQCLPNCKHEFSKCTSASIVLTSVTPRYPCCSGKQIYNIDQKTGYN